MWQKVWRQKMGGSWRTGLGVTKFLWSTPSHERFHIELFYYPTLQERVLPSKSSGEVPFLLAGSVHSAIRKASLSARKERTKWANSDSKLTDQENLNDFILDPPASTDRIKKLCRFDNIEFFLALMASNIKDIKYLQL